jgi:hypothetical protein
LVLRRIPPVSVAVFSLVGSAFVAGCGERGVPLPDRASPSSELAPVATASAQPLTQRHRDALQAVARAVKDAVAGRSPGGLDAVPAQTWETFMEVGRGADRGAFGPAWRHPRATATRSGLEVATRTIVERVDAVRRAGALGDAIVNTATRFAHALEEGDLVGAEERFRAFEAVPF